MKIILQLFAGKIGVMIKLIIVSFPKFKFGESE